jgi:hypothetical protein
VDNLHWQVRLSRLVCPLREAPREAAFVIEDCPDRGLPRVREAADGLGDHLGAADDPGKL